MAVTRSNVRNSGRNPVVGGVDVCEVSSDVSGAGGGGRGNGPNGGLGGRAHGSGAGGCGIGGLGLGMHSVQTAHAAFGVPKLSWHLRSQPAGAAEHHFRSGAAGWAARLAAALVAMGASAVGVAVAGATDAYSQRQCRSRCSRRPRMSTVSTTPHKQSSTALEAGHTTARAPYNLSTRSSRMCTRYTNLRSPFPRPRRRG